MEKNKKKENEKPTDIVEPIVALWIEAGKHSHYSSAAWDSVTFTGEVMRVGIHHTWCNASIWKLSDI